MKKLAVLLGLRDKIEKSFSGMLDDMISKFKNKQGLFKGIRKTYTALDGFADDPTKRGFTNVASTVDEQLAWFKQYTQDYFETIFSIEKTNASGITADLIVKGENWGKYSTLELLRLKSILDGKIKVMIQDLPVRGDGSIWKKSEDTTFTGKDVWEGTLDEGFTKTTLKRSYILPDPHPDIKRPPVLGEESTQANTGKYTSQEFSGEISMRQRAEMLADYEILYKAVIESMENANSAVAAISDLGAKVLNYLIK